MSTPLADVLRPKTFAEFVGQTHLIGDGKPVSAMIANKQLTSMILWGPPGCGKTTLARLMASTIDAQFVSFSAIGGSIKEIRSIIETATKQQGLYQNETILFVDEIHRFNKSQQDAFLPAVENGTIILIGATTENPGFEVNAPLISRARVYRLLPLTDEDVKQILNRAISSESSVQVDSDALDFIVSYAGGDARTAINALETARSVNNHITLPLIESTLQQKMIQYDKAGDNHYDTISAFIKSMRGGQPDATLHYLARMIKAGEDPVFIARRMVIFASEDVSNAQPTALVLATNCMQAVHMIGMPEAQIILAQTATYLATAKKSTASYDGLMSALKDIESMRLDPIPLHLRNASNKIMKQAGYAKGHVRYPWKEQEKGKKIEQEYMPINLKGKKYYDL